VNKVSFLAALCLLAVPAAGSAWEEPSSWSAIGTVQQWMDADAHFYRIEQLVGSKASRFYGSDQKEVYRRTFVHDSHLPRLGLAEFLALPDPEIAARREEAGRILDRVRGFRDRTAGLVMRVQSQVDVAWGLQDMDPRVLDDLLGRLHTATGLDPANPYAWHLLAYLSEAVGDLERSLGAHAGLQAALGVLPEDALGDLRRRADLDKAWLLRDLGRFSEAAALLDRLEAGARPGLEEKVLRGLIAAQTGEMDRAFRLAAELDGVAVPVFQRDWEAPGAAMLPGVLDPMAWSPKPSGHLKGWILALAWLREGDTAMAGQAFEEYNTMRHYHTFGRRFWAEAGAIYEITGRRELAERAWAQSLVYTPYYPYLVSKPYGLDLSGVTGRPGAQPFMLAYDSVFLAGNRLAYGSALVSQAMQAEDRAEQTALAEKAAYQLGICLRSGLNTAEASLMIGYAEAVLGNPLAMLQHAENAERILDRPGHDQTSRAAVEKLRAAALGKVKGPALGGLDRWKILDLAWSPGEDPATVEVRLRARLKENPQDGEARRDLARFLMRHGDPLEGVELARRPLAPADEDADAGLDEDLDLEDLVLVLETDRLQNDPARAEGLLDLLDEGAGDRWPDARLWTLVGFICMDHGIPGARAALEYALELDPDNDGLRRHLAVTKD